MEDSIEPICQQSSTTVNPVEESDTESVLIDIRELSIELPKLTDVSDCIHEDIHNILTEHLTISTKKLNKRKRKKIAKPTAAHLQNISKSFIQNRSPKHKLLLWRLESRQPRLIHAYPSIDTKNHNFTKKDRAQPTVLHKLYRSNCERVHKPHHFLLKCKPSNVKIIEMSKYSVE
nr:hypothetical transcript [Hymenolepis microstoma]